MVNYKYDNALHNAAAICDVEGLRRCLTPEALAACPINTRDRDDHTALHALCRYEGPRRDDDLYDLRRADDRNAEDVEVCVQLLVDAGADLEAHEENGWSPLHAVAWSSGDLGTEATSRLTTLLLRHGAKVDNRDNTVYSTLIHAAAAHGPSSMVSLLLKAGAAVNVLTEGDPRATPLDMALLFTRRTTLPILLRAGGVLNRYLRRGPDVGRLDQDCADYLAKVHAAGGFKKYEKAHLATLTKTFAPKFPMLPPEMVRHILTFGFRAGFY